MRAAPGTARANIDGLEVRNVEHPRRPLELAVHLARGTQIQSGEHRRAGKGSSKMPVTPRTSPDPWWGYGIFPPPQTSPGPHSKGSGVPPSSRTTQRRLL